MPFNFGQFHLILAGIGALLTFRRHLSSSQRWHLFFALLGVLFSSFMMLSPSLPIWRYVPFLAFTEYPSRMYGIAFLFSSFLAGASVLWFEKPPFFKVLVVIAVSLGLIISVAPYQFPRPFLPVQATPHYFVLYEKAFNKAGTTSASEYLSIWTLKKPKTPAVEPSLERKVLINTEAKLIEIKSHSLKFKVSLSEPAKLEVAQFYFPGWQGWINGAKIPLEPCPESGLICLDVQSGEHTITLAFGDTLTRTFGKIVSLFGLLLTIAITVRLKPEPGLKRFESNRLWWESFILALTLAGILILTLILKVWWVEQHTFWFRLYSPQGQALPAQHHVNSTLGGKVALIGYDVASKIVHQGDVLHVRLYWQALKSLDKDYSSFVHLIGPDGHLYAQSDSMHPAYIPTSTWNPALYVVDEHFINIPFNTPPGVFTLRVGLYELSTMKVLGEAELPEQVYIQLKRVSKPPKKYLQIFPDEGIKLLGYKLTHEEDRLILYLYWQAERRVSRDLHVFVHLVNAQGNIIAQADGPPVKGFYPSSKWLPKQIIEDVREIPVPCGTSPKMILVGLYDLTTLQRVPVFRENGVRWENDSIQIELLP